LCGATQPESSKLSSETLNVTGPAIEAPDGERE